MEHTSRARFTGREQTLKVLSEYPVRRLSHAFKGCEMSILRHLRSRPGISTALGTAFAIIAGLMLLGFVSRAMKTERGGSLVKIPIARKDIAMGVALTTDMLGSRNTPPATLFPERFERFLRYRGREP